MKCSTNILQIIKTYKRHYGWNEKWMREKVFLFLFLWQLKNLATVWSILSDILIWRAKLKRKKNQQTTKPHTTYVCVVQQVKKDQCVKFSFRILLVNSALVLSLQWAGFVCWSRLMKWLMWKSTHRNTSTSINIKRHISQTYFDIRCILTHL